MTDAQDKLKRIDDHGATVDAAVARRRERDANPPEDKTALSWWFPKIEAAGLPVPRTMIRRIPVDAQAAVWARLDGNEGNPEQERALTHFCDWIKQSADKLGWPAFLRTDQTAGKHEWSKCCFLKSPDDVLDHVVNLAMHSEMSGFPGKPWHTWAVRESLPTMPVGICPRYDDMPVCREFRCFVSNCHFMCIHPYWPRHALERGGAVMDEAAHQHMEALDPDTRQVLVEMAMGAGWACSEPNQPVASASGSWSVDILQTERGWFITDMAEAGKSWHEWPECPNYTDLVWP